MGTCPISQACKISLPERLHSMMLVPPPSINQTWSGSSVSTANVAAQSPVRAVSQRPGPVLAGDRFTGLPTSAVQSKSVQFGGAGKAVGFGLGGLASGAILWPLSLVTGFFGLFIHPLLPVAALMGVAPIGLAIWGAVAGAKSK